MPRWRTSKLLEAADMTQAAIRTTSSSPISHGLALTAASGPWNGLTRTDEEHGRSDSEEPGDFVKPRKLALIALSVGAVVVAGLATGFVRPSRANRDSRPAYDQFPTHEQAEREPVRSG